MSKPGRLRYIFYENAKKAVVQEADATTRWK
jgi:hypothetical protein